MLWVFSLVCLGTCIFKHNHANYFRAPFPHEWTDIFPMSECHGTLFVGSRLTHEHRVQNSWKTELRFRRYGRRKSDENLEMGEIVKFMSVFNFGTLRPKSVSIFGTLPPKLDSDTKLHNFPDTKLHHFGTLLPKSVSIFGSQPPKLGLTCTIYSRQFHFLLCIVLLLSLISCPFTSFAHNRLKTQSHLFTKHSSFSQGT